MSTTVIIIGVAVLILFLLVLISTSYVKAPPAVAYIISGISKEPRSLCGKGGFKVPFLERLDKVYLGQISVDIKTETSVPTNDFINVDVDAVAKIRVIQTVEGIRLAAKNFLNMNPEQIASQVQDSLQGNMREIIGTLDLKRLNTDRDGFSDEVMKKASPDMEKLGIEILSCNIQNVTDKDGLIYALGADNTAKIKKDAAITKANADREVAVAVAKAEQEANEARVKSQTSIAEQNNALELKKADLKRTQDTQRAIADAAYSIQEQEQLLTINQKTVDAEIEKTKRMQILSQEQIAIKQNELSAKVNKEADAKKYQTEVEASAELEQRKRKAEAEAYEAEQLAKAQKAKADAEKYKLQQDAEGKKALADAEAYGISEKGKAEAEAIRLKGEAEAAAMEKKAEAYKKYGNAAITEMIVKVLPEVAEKVADPMKSIKGVNIYGTDGSGMTGLSGNVPVVIKQTFDVVKEATGVDLQDVMKASTLEAKTDRNIKGDISLDHESNL